MNELPQWIQKLKPSAIQRNQPVQHDDSGISFSVGLPDSQLFPLEAFIDAANRSIHVGTLQYTKPLKRLKQQIVNLMTLRSIECDESQVVLTTGSQQGIYLVSKLFSHPETKMFLENILYPNVALAVQSSSSRIHTINTHLQTGIEVDEIELGLNGKKSSALAYIISDGHNPLGVSISEAKRHQLSALVSEYAIPLIEDDAYGFIHYDECNTKPVKADAMDHVFYLGSFSKILSPSLRVGWMIVPPQYVEQLEVMKEALDLNVASLSQHLLVNLLDQFDLSAHLNRIRKHYAHKRDITLAAIKQYFPPNISYSVPTHGFFIWVNIHHPVEMETVLAECIKSHGVNFINGCHFSLNASEADYPAMRLSFASLSPQKIEQGIKVIGSNLDPLFSPL